MTSGRTIGSPIGVSYLRALGERAPLVLAPGGGAISALVAVPAGEGAEAFGLEPVAPGIGRLRGSRERLEAFGASHPSLRLEVASPIRLLNDRAGTWVRADLARRERGVDGRGVFIGVADTGLDVTHPDMLDGAGLSRVAWMLDLSLDPIGIHADLEAKFGVVDPTTGAPIKGAVLSKAMLDTLLDDIANGRCVELPTRRCAPTDDVGHGTHVAGTAAARATTSPYGGIAPGADLVIVRLNRDRGQGIDNDDLVRAVQFMFDRASADDRPLVANVSLGGDFGPHDGTMLWERAIASLVGPEQPGRIVVAAAGNTGSVIETPIHQSVRVTEGTRMRVPIRTSGASAGSVQVWVTLRRGAEVAIGLDGPDGEWIAPVSRGRQAGRNTEDYNAGVIYGSELEGSVIPADSTSGVVVWAGRWPTGTYYVTLEGSGLADLYVQGLGDAATGEFPASFVHGVREGTVTMPATHPSIIAVGCTVSRARWTSIAGHDIGIRVAELDAPGGFPVLDASGRPILREIVDGDVCWFSSAGPTLAGVPKPEIAAPGAVIVSAMSRSAGPDSSSGIFANPSCPKTAEGEASDKCMQVDETHGVSVGTSMSSPVVAGVVALLLQEDRTLTQDKVLALLQGGAHPFRGAAPYADQSGPGEVDAFGSLVALDRMRAPATHLPSRARSWLTTSADYVAADGSTPLTVILELRTEAGDAADFFEPGRLSPVVTVRGEPVGPSPEIVRRGPGVWFFTWHPRPGLGGETATLGATFDGEPIVAPRALPIAVDAWSAGYRSRAEGASCASAPSGSHAARAEPFALLAALAVVTLRRSSRASREAPTSRRPDRSGTPDRRR